MINTKFVAAAIIAASVFASPGHAQENTGPGSHFGELPVSPDTIDAEDDMEVMTDVEFFESAGYTVPDFNVYFDLRNEVGREIVAPDYAKRTGKIAPEENRLEVASAYLTGGDFNDIVIYSFLPGDCAMGCLAQVYKTTDGLKWNKVLEFTSLGFAYKQADGDKPTEVVAVGNDKYPSRIYVWDGKAFRPK